MTLADFAKTRSLMVANQLFPIGIHNARLKHAMQLIPREEFVPDALKHLAYADQTISHSKDHFLIRPTILAQMIEALDLTGKEKVLTIGGGGYCQLLLGYMVSEVVGLESRQEIVEKSKKIADSLHMENVKTFLGNLDGGILDEAPFDCILICGGVEIIPPKLFEQLAEEGMLIVVLQKSSHQGECRLYKKIGTDISSSYCFEATIPTIPEFKQKRGFSFP